jgi:hypothetical protein
MFFLLTITTLLGSILALEARAWLPHLSRRLVSRAMKKFPRELPLHLRKRWTEEIEADLASFHDRPLSGLVFAFRVWLKGGRDLAAELALQQAMATGQADPEVGDEEEGEALSVTALALLKASFDTSLVVLLQLLESSLKEIVARPPQDRQARLGELRSALSHPALRRAMNRFDPDVSTEEGLKIALVLKDLRKEVEGWNDRE